MKLKKKANATVPIEKTAHEATESSAPINRNVFKAGAIERMDDCCYFICASADPYSRMRSKFSVFSEVLRLLTLSKLKLSLFTERMWHGDKI